MSLPSRSARLTGAPPPRADEGVRRIRNETDALLNCGNAVLHVSFHFGSVLGSAHVLRISCAPAADGVGVGVAGGSSLVADGGDRCNRGHGDARWDASLKRRAQDLLAGGGFVRDVPGRQLGRSDGFRNRERRWMGVRQDIHSVNGRELCGHCKTPRAVSRLDDFLVPDIPRV